MKPTLCVFIGDTQCGSTTALALKDYELEEGRPYSLTRDQEWLTECWADAINRVKACAVGHQVFVGFGAEAIDGSNHHGTTQTSGTPVNQVHMAVELCRPYFNMADECRALTGTETHSGLESEMDHLFAKEIGNVRCQPYWALNISGRLLDWAHHGINVAQNPVSELNGMNLAADKVYWRCKEKSLRVPDIIVRHHAHRSPRPIVRRGITVAVAGCWQLSTAHGHRIAAGSPPDIGLLLWWPEAMGIERIVYDVPRGINYVRFSDRRSDASGGLVRRGDVGDGGSSTPQENP